MCEAWGRCSLIFHWGKVSQSNPELSNMAGPLSQLVLGIPVTVF